MAKSKAYMDMYYAMADGVPVVPTSDGRRLGKAQKVTSQSLTKREARQLEADYNWQYERGVFEDGKTGDLYQSNYLYRIRSHGFDNFEILWRRRIL